MGDRFTDEEVDEIYREAPIKDGLFDFREFTRILKHGTKDKDDDPTPWTVTHWSIQAASRPTDQSLLVDPLTYPC